MIIIKKIIKPTILKNSLKSFMCSLPKQQTKFSKQMGLDKQLDDLYITTKKVQKSKSKTYQFTIFFSLTIVGSLCITYLMYEKNFMRMLIVKDMYQNILNPSKQNRIKLYQSIIRYQQKYYARKNIFNDGFIQKIIEKIRFESKQGQFQGKQQYQNILVYNLGNKKNQSNFYGIYKDYFLELLGKEKNINSQNNQNNDNKKDPKTSKNENRKIQMTNNLKNMIKTIIQKGNVQNIFLVKQVLKKSKLSQHIFKKQQYKKILKENILRLEQQIKKKQQIVQDIEQKNPQSMLQPYKFQVKMNKIWLNQILKSTQ